MFAITSLVPTQLITMDRFIICIVFYVAIFVLTINVLGSANQFTWDFTVFPQSLAIAFSAVALHLVTVGYVQSELYFAPPPFNPRGTSFLLMNDYFMWAKPFDVLAQQGLIYGLHRHLVVRGKTLGEIQVIFLVAFGIPHIFQIILTEIVVGIGFAIASLTGAVLFPYFHFRYSSGPALCFLLHLITYTLTALIVWSVFNKSGPG